MVIYAGQNYGATLGLDTACHILQRSSCWSSPWTASFRQSIASGQTYLEEGMMLHGPIEVVRTHKNDGRNLHWTFIVRTHKNDGKKLYMSILCFLNIFSSSTCYNTPHFMTELQISSLYPNSGGTKVLGDLTSMYKICTDWISTYEICSTYLLPNVNRWLIYFFNLPNLWFNTHDLT